MSPERSGSRTRPSAWTLVVAALAAVFLIASGVVAIAIGRGDLSYALAIPGAAMLFLAFYSYGTDQIGNRL